MCLLSPSAPSPRSWTTAQGEVRKKDWEDLRDAFDAEIYAGWVVSPSAGTAAGFSKKFFPALDGRKTADQAKQDAAYQYENPDYFINNFQIKEGGGKVVDLSPP